MEKDHRALDALRGLGALGIAFAAWSEFVTPGGLGQIAGRFFQFIDLFFVASGFILAAIYRDAISRPGDLATVLILRLARLYPAHLFYLAPLVALSLAHPGAGGPLQGLFAELTLTLPFADAAARGWSAVGWYVAAEFWAAALFGLACLAGLARTPAGRGALALAILFAAVWRSGAGSAGASPDGVVGGADALARGIYGFGLGAAAESLLRIRVLRAVIRRAGAEAEIAALTLVAIALSAGEDGRLWAAPAAFATAAAVFTCSRGPVRRALSAAPFRLLGAHAYAIYMGHFVLLTPFLALNAALDGAAPDAVAHLIGVYLTLCAVMAALAVRLVETPTRAAARAWLGGRSWASPTVTAAAI